MIEKEKIAIIAITKHGAALAEKLHGGLKSGMGYNGAETIQDLWRARIVKVTNAGLKENYPHHLAAIEGDESQGDE